MIKLDQVPIGSAMFMHLGDLHLGIKFHKRSLIPDQRYALDQVIDSIRVGRCHLIIAGDVFDTVNPSIEAQELWFDFLENLGRTNRECRTHTFIIAGNHDSAARLSLARTFVEESNIHIVDKNNLYQIFCLYDEYLKAYLQLVCVPFAKPATLESYYRRYPEKKPDTDIDLDSYDATYAEILRMIKSEIEINDRTLLIAHQTFEGGKTGESEFKPFMSDAISLNTVNDFPAVLAGHLHAYQKLGNVHYSGSLLPYAFGDEYNQGVSIWRHIPNKDKISWIQERTSMKIMHKLRVVEGNLEHCLNEQVLPTEYICATEFVKVKLTGCLHFDEAVAKLQDKFPILLSVVCDDGDQWIADLDKPVQAFTNIQEALDAFCDHLEIPRFEGEKKKLIQEALDAFSQAEN